jgi:hypothetical protein
MNVCKTEHLLSPEGREFLSDPLLYNALAKIAATVNSTPEEYLLRFEKALAEDPERMIEIFEKLPHFRS